MTILAVTGLTREAETVGIQGQDCVLDRRERLRIDIHHRAGRHPHPLQPGKRRKIGIHPSPLAIIPSAAPSGHRDISTGARI